MRSGLASDDLVRRHHRGERRQAASGASRRVRARRRASSAPPSSRSCPVSTNLLALDIGGTTAKAALVNDGEPQIADQFEVGSSAVATVTAQRGQGYPVLTPVISLVEIGAGGGTSPMSIRAAR